MTANAKDLLLQYSEEQFHPSVLDRVCHTINIGPISAEFCGSLMPPMVSVKLVIFGVTIANCTLSNEHPSCKIGGSKFGVKAELELTLNFPKVHYMFTGCLPFAGCKTLEGDIIV